VLVGIASVVVVYLYFFSAILPFGHRAVSEERGKFEQEYRQLSADLSKARQTLTNREEVEQQYQVITRRWEVASELLPEERELPSLLRRVSLVGQQSGVEFELFEPQSMIAGEVYTENPVNVRVVGSYHEVGAFLAEVANLQRIVNVSNLELSDLDEDELEGRKTVRASFTATAYTLNMDGLNGQRGRKGEKDEG
jgi:type IV pilus assembly protein PilO